MLALRSTLAKVWVALVALGSSSYITGGGGGVLRASPFLTFQVATKLSLSSSSSSYPILFASAEAYQTYRAPAEGYDPSDIIQPAPNYGEDGDDIDPTTPQAVTDSVILGTSPPQQREVNLLSPPTPTTSFTTADTAAVTTFKRIVPHSSVLDGDTGVLRIPLGIDVDPAVGYPMADILVAQTADGMPAVNLLELNARNPLMRARTSYLPGQRRYLEGYTSALLKIDNGIVYSYEDNIVIGDNSRVFMMGGCGENIAGWAVATTDDGRGGIVQEWDSPSMDDLSKDGLHRFGALAVLVQRLGRTYFHWMTETLPRLTQFLTVLASDGMEVLKRVRYLAYDVPFIHDALRLLGIDMGRQVIFFDQDSVYTAETLYAISSAPCGQPPRPLLKHVQNHMFNYLYPQPPPGAPPKVVERAKRRLKYANRRGLALLVLQGGTRGGRSGSSSPSEALDNVDEVTQAVRRVYIDKMAKAGHKVDLIVVDTRLQQGDGKKGGQASLLSQYSLWRRAELIVAMPGGSLANIMWSQNGTKVVELVPILPNTLGRRATITYADMAGSLELPYAMVPINTTSPNERYKVPIHFLESALRLVMEA